ncbi:uncharacterized protein LOC132048633 [Lycium ferocissimum]|uniref:uncharacterized protein LOC132048633 n=1 Tax=Lycium ferocissimum TaxID=112874 RepID=UPI00281521A8|nr:uncharacterized protein LOC132048633 [Lycium ferocissimum]
MECVTTTKYTIAINGGLHGNIEGKRGLRQDDPLSPLLFVIFMEYFTRIMKWVSEQERFEYHTKCKSLKLNHLCFADDMLIFSKGDFLPVVMLLRGLKTFSEASGLTTNNAKSNIFSANMPAQVIDDLCELTGYSKGRLPFRYLGVPISSKRLSAVECEMLVEKMVAKIRTWGSRNLSYAGRVQLVNSVLMHIHAYWSFIFLLPKGVMKEIVAICRNFIWSGHTTTGKSPLVAWDDICKPQKEFGLGVKDCHIWNEAAVAKYIWNIANKTDNLWVKWVHHIYLKEIDWWNISLHKTVAGTGRKYAG